MAARVHGGRTRQAAGHSCHRDRWREGGGWSPRGGRVLEVQGSLAETRAMSPRALAAPLAKLARPVLDKRGRAFAALVGEWAALIGPALAPLTLPEKLTTGPTSEVEPGGVLTLRVAGA